MYTVNQGLRLYAVNAVMLCQHAPNSIADDFLLLNLTCWQHVSLTVRT